MVDNTTYQNFERKMKWLENKLSDDFAKGYFTGTIVTMSVAFGIPILKGVIGG